MESNRLSFHSNIPIKLSILQAKKLYQQSIFKLPNPIVRIYISNQISKQRNLITTTNTCIQTANPKFNFSTNLKTFQNGQVIRLEIWDEKNQNVGAKNGFLGGKEITSQNIMNHVKSKKKSIILKPLEKLNQSVNNLKFSNSSLQINVELLDVGIKQTSEPTLNQISNLNNIPVRSSSLLNNVISSESNSSSSNNFYIPTQKMNTRTNLPLLETDSPWNSASSSSTDNHLSLSANGIQNDDEILFNPKFKSTLKNSPRGPIEPKTMMSRLSPILTDIPRNNFVNINCDKKFNSCIDLHFGNKNRNEHTDRIINDDKRKQSNLPQGWQQLQTNNNKIYYTNLQKSSWFDPRIEIFEKSNLKSLLPTSLNFQNEKIFLKYPWSTFVKNQKRSFKNEINNIVQYTDPRVESWLDENFDRYFNKNGTKRQNLIDLNSLFLENLQIGNVNSTSPNSTSPDVLRRFVTPDRNRDCSFGHQENIRSQQENQRRQEGMERTRQDNLWSQPDDRRRQSDDLRRQPDNQKRQTDNQNMPQEFNNFYQQNDITTNQNHHSDTTFINTAFPLDKTCQIQNKQSLQQRLKHARENLLNVNYIHGVYCRINISREDAFEASYKLILGKRPSELKWRVAVKFDNEVGIDYGGVQRDWINLVGTRLFNVNYGLFSYTRNYNLYINVNSKIINKDHLTYFRFAGRLLGMALYHDLTLPCPLALPIFKYLLNKPVTYLDLINFDYEVYNSIKILANLDTTQIEDLMLTFSVGEDMFDKVFVTELIENGANINVNADNRDKYIKLFVYHKLYNNIKKQLKALRTGFHEIVEFNHLKQIFKTEHELKLALNGISKINVQDWRQNTTYKNCHDNTIQCVWFWQILDHWNDEYKSQFLNFCTGNGRVPLNGFKELRANPDKNEIKLFCIYMNKTENPENVNDRLPKAHTCFNRLDLPKYTSYTKMKEKLEYVILNDVGFGIE